MDKVYVLFLTLTAGTCLMGAPAASAPAAKAPAPTAAKTQTLPGNRHLVLPDPGRTVLPESRRGY